MTKKSKNASTKTAGNQPEGPETSVFTASLPRLIPQDDPEFTRRGPRLDKDGKPQYLVDLIPDRKYTDEDESGVGTNSENESFQENALLVLHSVMFSLCLSLFFGIFTSLVNQQYGIDNDFREICISALKAIPCPSKKTVAQNNATFGVYPNLNILQPSNTKNIFLVLYSIHSLYILCVEVQGVQDSEIANSIHINLLWMLLCTPKPPRTKTWSNETCTWVDHTVDVSGINYGLETCVY
ncbi:hypothetical protein AX774_g5341 [Zancudomyces culisetae]|uniref:Uncharacterized protein n=1 Tax=Zancudomyces culisetae TaxID=1213189 RepID=A0A1R1PJS4_ZANCU|nr:hypothetical protein AX774_g5341 [Zancudomyces culisetae]|eukprot:OMH81214.1 hypothetical protein AX774_g5341 [Zancudomyces culisetae]